MREKKLLEAAQNWDAIANAPGVPVRLCGLRAGDRSAHFGRTGTVQLAQHFTRCRVYGSDAGDGEFDVGGHLRRSVRGTERARQSFHLPSMNCHPERSEGPAVCCADKKARSGQI